MKKGFTLIEMVGVMVILSLLMLFVMPNIINYIKKGGDTKDTVVKTLVYDAASKYIDDNKKMFKQDNKNTYCISLYTLASEGYVESPIVLSGSNEDITSETSTKSVKVTYDKKYKYELTDECTGIVNPTPVLTKGLTPVVYDEENENWVVVDKNDPNWYNYDEQKWANAVVLGTDVIKNVGDTVAVDGTEAKMMLVWIPRYEYKYTNLGNQYAGGTQNQPGEIEVNFVLKNKKNGSSNEYKVHPAFTFGDQELSGIWVGKFELSSTNNSLQVSNLRVLPNISSLRSKSVSQFFTVIKEIESDSTFELYNVDTHMIKNSEWGAVAYLSQSKYGKYGNTDYNGIQKKIYLNNSSQYYTGRSGGNITGNTSINETYTNESSEEQKTKYGFYTYDGYLLEYDTNNKTTTRDINKGTGASTTGNIYGIYDMSGSAWDFVMGVYGDEDGIYSGSDEESNSGFNGKTGNDNKIIKDGIEVPDIKYYDKYTTNNPETACDRGICYGHALSETSKWYKDVVNMIRPKNPWIVRGGDILYAGIFSSSYYSGKSYTSGATHIVISTK